MSRFLLLAPLLLFLGMTYLVPLSSVMLQSVTSPEPGIQNYEQVIADPLVWGVSWRTLRICLSVTVMAVVLAYPITLLWVRGGTVTRVLVELTIMVPFWLSVLSRAFGWLSLLSNRGLINTWLQSVGLISDPLTLVRNEFGVVISMVHFLIPFAVLPLASAMRSIDERVILAARGMGASSLRIFWQIFVPMTKSGIIGAGLLVFVFALGFYIIPVLLGGGRSVMIAELIFLRIFQIPNWGVAAALSALLMVFIGGFLIALIKRSGVTAR